MTSSSTYYIGRTVGKCLIDSIIGAGGMAWVFKGHHPDLSMPRAIKVLKPIDDLMEPSKKTLVIERFMREAQIAARLDHPNIIKIFDVSSQEDLHYIEMEYLDGVSLRTFLETHKEPIPPSVVCCIMYLMAEALFYAHTVVLPFNDSTVAGLVHRDLKPDNIFLTKTGVLKILDFGIAKVDTMSLTTSTEARNVTGTLSYMSPEQLDCKTLDARSDIFSMGIIFYELITHMNPFKAEETAKMIKNITMAEYNLIPKVLPGFPPELSELVDGCLHSSPSDRFSSCADLKKALQGLFPMFGIVNPSDELKEFITTGKAPSPSNSVKLKTSRKSLLPYALIIILALVVLIFLLIGTPSLSGHKGESEKPKASSLKTPRGPALADMLESSSPAAVLTPAPALSQAQEYASEPASKPVETINRAIPSPLSEAVSDRPKKIESTVSKRPNTKMAEPVVKAAVSQAPSLPLSDSVGIYFNAGNLTRAVAILTFSKPAVLDKAYSSKLPSSDAVSFFYKGFSAQAASNYQLATALYESAIRNQTSFTESRVYFIQQSMLNKAICYTSMYNQGDKSAKDKAILSWNGLLKLNPSPALVELANNNIKDL